MSDTQGAGCISYRRIGIGTVLIALALAMILLAASSASAASHLSVDTAQVDCDTTVAEAESIQTAVDGAIAGETICIEEGNFSESIVVGVDNVTIAAADGASPVLEGAGEATAIHVDDAQNVTIANVTIRGYADEGVRVTGTSDNLTVSDADIEGSEWGIYLLDDAGTDATIRRNRISDNAVRPIHVGENTDRVGIHDNEILEGEALYGIYVQSRNASVTNNTVVDGRIRAMGLDTAVRNNEVSGVDIGIDASADADGIIIENNTIGDVETGISATVNSPMIRNNTVSNATIGLELDGVATATIRDNALATGLSLNGDPATPGHYDHDVTNNTLDDGSLVYLNGEASPSIPANAGQIFVVDSSNVTISGFDLSGVASGIFVAGSPDTDIANNTIADIGGSGIRVWSSDSVRVADNDAETIGHRTSVASVQIVSSQHAVLERNTVTDAEEEALQVETSPDSRLAGNVLRENYQGIQVTGADRTVLTNNTVTGSHHGTGFVSNLDGAVQLMNSYALDVRGNNVSDNAATGIYDNRDGDVTNATFTDNIVSGNEEDGFNWGRGDEATFENNTIDWNGGTGLDGPREATVRNNSISNNAAGIDVAPDAVIDSNTVNSNGGNGIQAYRNSIIRNNTVDDNDNRGLLIGMSFSPSSDPNRIENNTVRGNPIDLQIDNAARLTVRNNTFESGVYLEAGGTPDQGLLTTHTFEDNTVGGDPLVHVHEQDNVTVTGPAGQVIVTNGTDVTLEDLSFRNTAAAVQVAFSNGTAVTGISISDSTGEFPTRAALTMWGSHESTIIDSVLTDNPHLGVELIGSTNTTVLDTRIAGSGDEALSVDLENTGVAAHGNNLSANGEGIANLGNQQINATNNWWGDPSGPSGGESDPETGTTASGTGDSVSSDVRFDPWLGAPPADTADGNVSILDTNAPIVEGETLIVNASVANFLAETENKTVSLESPAGTAVDSTTVSVPANGTETLQLSWNTSMGDAGSDAITVVSGAVSDTADVTIEALDPAEFLVSVTDTTSPVAAGDTLDVNVTVENAGDRGGTQSITLADIDGTTVDSSPVTVGPKATESITLSWVTDGDDVGIGSVEVASENDSTLETVEVEQPDDGTLTGTILDANTSDPIIGSTTVTATAGEQSYTTVTNNSSEYTLDVPPGTYDLEADLNSTDEVYEPGTVTDVAVEENETRTVDIFLEFVAPPTAAFSHSPTTPAVNETVTFDASNSTFDTEFALYSWDVTSDGEADVTDVVPVFNYSFESPGDYPVTLSVLDENNQIATANATVSVTGNETTTLTGAVTDAETSGGIEGATVEAVGAGVDTETGPNGEYTLPVDAGTYDLTVTHEDYLAETIENVSVTADSETEQNASLVPIITYEGTITDDGSVHSLGFPGPVAGTIQEAFPNGTAGIGAIFEYSENGWEQVTDLDRSPNAMDSLVLTTIGEGNSIDVTVQIKPLSSTEQRTVHTGWNFIAAPAQTDADAGFSDGVNDSLMVLDQYEHVTAGAVGSIDRFDTYVLGSQDWGEPAPTLNPFAGYFVYFNEGGSVPSALDNATNRSDADTRLGLIG